jgi:MFS transporter, DHA2 family, metal-tetracycline-proton antiporter
VSGQEPLSRAAGANVASAPAQVAPGLVLATLAGLIIVVVANNSMGSLAQPDIALAFAAGPADVGWIVFGYSVSFAVSTAAWGALGQRFGVGRSFAVGVVVLALASLAAALAPSLPMLVAARVAQGFGSGAIPTLGNALIGQHFSGPRRASALGVMIGSVGTGLAIGPILGGVLLDLAGWRAVVGLAVLTAPAVVLVLRADQRRGNEGARLDFVGAGLVGGAAIAAVFVLNRGPVVGLAPITLLALAVLAVALPAALWHSLRRGGSFMPRAVIGEPNYRRLVTLGAVGMCAFLGSLVIVPTAVDRAQGLAGIELGLVLVPMALTSAVLSPNNGRVTGRLGHTATARLSLALLAAGPIALGLLGAAASPVALAAALVPMGAGFALLNAPLVDQLMTVFEGPLAPVAVGSYNLLFFLGGSLGAALSTAILQARVALPLAPPVAEPGFTTATLLLAVLPGTAALLVGRSLRRPRRQSASER